MVLTRLLRVVALWQKAQVEFHGQYSLERLTRFVEYSQQTSWQRVVVFMVVTPLPCLVAILAFEMVKLKPPEAGASDNCGFWLRLFGIQWITLLTSTLLFHRALGLPSLNIWFVAVTTALSNVIPTAVGYGLAHAIGFPVPFILHLVLPSWILGGSVITLILLKPYLHQFSILKPKAVEFCKTYSIPGTLAILYPIYFYIFRHLHSSYQGILSLLVPTVKIATKNAMSYLFRIQTDVRPEEMVFTIEVFTSLFATFSMQSSSIVPIILLTGIDVAQACLSLYDILSLASILEHSRIKLQPNHVTHIPNTVNSIQKLLDDVFEIAMQLDEASRQRIASAALHRPQYPIRIEPTNQEHLTHRIDSTMKAFVLKPEQMLSKSSVLAVLPEFETKLTTSHDSKSRLESSNTNGDLITCHNEELVLQLLRFLHATEYIVLVEFTTVIVPVIYGLFSCAYLSNFFLYSLSHNLSNTPPLWTALYLSVAFRLPNHEFYPQLQGVNYQQQHQLMTTIFIYAAIELAVFTMVSFIVWWRLHFSLLKQLVFVLDSQWRYVQMRLVVWVLYVIQSSLIHFGVDYSFRFKWLHQTSS